jgi:hypothetical protein
VKWLSRERASSLTPRSRHDAAGGARVDGTGAVTALLLALVLAGCASVACQPTRIVVVKKDERVRPDSSLGLRTTETGRIEEGPLTLIREYWVQAEDGAWYRVSAGQFEEAEPNGVLEICR